MSNKISQKQGFTIIEVVLVLAIAGLIFLMVFVAFPALQRNQRDTQRRQAYADLSAAVISSATNSNGHFPGDGAEAALATSMGTDPQTGAAYTVDVRGLANMPNPTVGNVFVVSGANCGTNGATPTADTNTNHFIVYGFLEGGLYCLDGTI